MSQFAFLIPLFPFLAFGLIALLPQLNRNHRASSWLAILSMALSAVLAYAVLFETLGKGPEAAQDPLGNATAVQWFPYGDGKFFMGWMIDPLAAVMVFMVTTVCLMIFIYSVGYMREHGEDDPRYSRFFAYISLFAAAMLALVISSNLLMFFMAWEVMGFCSYALIGFWSFRGGHEHHIDDAQVARAKYAAIKAFLTTRVGDILFMTGMIFLFLVAGTLDFKELFSAQKLAALKVAMYGGIPWLTIITLLLLGGTIGKSAQFPLHIWLPDAMEGPTPVSALIHAATMVAAGVYLIARTYPLYLTADPNVLNTVALVGAFTAAFAATIAVAQDDIKRVIAYSTISQLGYMIAGLGIIAYGAGTFHLFTHSFFKALLFLAAGSVIHSFGANDMMKMGGLRNKMPITFATFGIGSLALMGIPPFAGFFSKDGILGEALKKATGSELTHAAGDPISAVVYGLLIFAAFLTAFYTTRQIALTFLGNPRDQHAYDHAHESPTVMWLPLVVLAVFAFGIGIINAPTIGAFGTFVAEKGVLGIPKALFEVEQLGGEYLLGAGISVAAALAGIALGLVLYWFRPLRAGESDPLTILGPVWTLVRNKYYLDEVYGFAIRVSGAVVSGLVVRFGVWLGDAMFVVDRVIVDGLVNLGGAIGRGLGNASRWVDQNVVDGLVNQIAEITGEVAGYTRALQTGRIQNYLLIAASGAVLLALAYVFRFLGVLGG